MLGGAAMKLDAQQIPLAVVSASMARPEHPAVQIGEKTITWSRLRDGASRAANILALRGLRTGDRIALLGPISIEWVIAFHAIDWLGGIVVPLPCQAPSTELAEVIHETQPAGIVASNLELLPKTPAITIPLETLRPNVTHETPLREERLQPLEEVRALLMTSGSSGRPRWNPLTTRQLIFSAFGSAIRLGHHPDDRWLSALPLHHVGGLSVLWRTARYGTTAVLHPRFEPAAFSQALDAGIHLTSVVPDMLQRVLDTRTDRPFNQSLRVILVGGAASDPHLRARCRAISAPVAFTWGMTEAASQVTTCEPGMATDEAHSGTPLPFTRVSSHEGLLTVYGPTTENGTWQTQDLGHINAAGHVHIQGRADHVISSGGEKFAPESLESILRGHPDVSDVGVSAIRDTRWGQRPVAWVVAKTANQQPDDDTMTAWIRARVSAFKAPVSWRWTTSLPRTDLGKLQRSVLASWTEQAHLGQRLPHLDGDNNRTEVGHVDEHVNVANGRAQDPIVDADDTEDKGERTATNTVDRHLDPKTLSHPHGVAVVGLSVGQGHAPDPLLKDGLEVKTERTEELLVGHMTVLEHTTKERDSRAVDLLETNRDDVLEGHDGLQEKRTNGNWEDAR
jgi:O-succinylbenzoic acid--CoA ligase